MKLMIPLKFVKHEYMHFIIKEQRNNGEDVPYSKFYQTYIFGYIAGYQWSADE